MIQHKIVSYHGECAGPNGQTVHYYKARCGKDIYAVHTFAEGQGITVGPPPHAACGKCYKGEQPVPVTPATPRGMGDVNQLTVLREEVQDDMGRVDADDGMGRLEETP